MMSANVCILTGLVRLLLDAADNKHRERQHQPIKRMGREWER